MVKSLLCTAILLFYTIIMEHCIDIRVFFLFRSGVDRHTQVQWVEKFTYLGIWVWGKLANYFEENITSLMAQIAKKCQSWKALPLSPVGRVNLIKMVYLPKFLYFFRNTLISIPKVTSTKLYSLIRTFIWAGKTPRLAKRTLQLPLSQGGLALLLGSSTGDYLLMV